MAKKLTLHSTPISVISNLYFHDGKSCTEIGILFGCCTGSVRNYMNKHGISLRTLSEAMFISSNNQETQRKRRESMLGKPSGALGKSWTQREDSKTRMNGRTGSNNYNWRGGATSDIEHIRNQRRNHKAIRRGKSPHMPAWADKDVIASIYKEAKEKGLTVDHIIPLCNKLVCGLHCEENLQLLTSEENSRKGNSFDINAAQNIRNEAQRMIAAGIAGTASRGTVSQVRGRKPSVLARAVDVRSSVL